MTSTAQDAAAPTVRIIGRNATRLWGLETTERTRRLACAARLDFDADVRSGSADAGLEGGLLVHAGYAFDPGWIGHLAAAPGTVLTLAGIPVIAHVRGSNEFVAVAAAIAADTSLSDPGQMAIIAFEDGPSIENKALRKRETPFLDRLTPATVRALERASYFGAYKGVTDLLTKYLWPEWALVLTRIAARIGMTPNMVTAIGAVLCVAATFAFAAGQYWLGTAMGLVFMVLDTVDGKLARCTVTSSWWGNIFDHGIDLVHPPFWWWFWATGLAHRGLALPGEAFAWTMIALIGGYVVQRVIEGVFLRRYGGIHIHVWERIDSRFRLITARRNPNMVILFASLLFARPDWGIVAVAVWTVISLVFHGVRLAQAMAREKRGQAIATWLAEG